MRGSYKRGRNWFTAMGILFIVMAGIILARNLLLYGPEFLVDYFISQEVTNEKISAGMIGFGAFLIFLGFRKRYE